MGKKVLSQQRRALVDDQLHKLFWGAQVTAVVCILNIVLFGKNVFAGTHSFFFRPDLITFIVGLVVTSLLLVVLSRGKTSIAVSVFFLLWTAVMIFITWHGGGLYSPFVLSFPILLFFAAWFADKLTYFAVFIVLCVSIVFIGFNHILGWFPEPQEALIGGIPRIIGALILTVLSGYVCWTFGKLLKGSFDGLELENQRVIESEAVIKKLAETDGLTGLLNRIGAKSRYKVMLETFNHTKENITVYFIDLDNFKSINNLFDHHAGDQLLKTMSERLGALLPDDGFACRYGGDEFALVIRASREFDEKQFAADMLKAMAQSHSILGTEAEVTGSIGIAVVRDSETSFISICKKADIAMHKAKNSGKNSFHLYSDELDREYMRNLNMVNSLKNAISSNLLDLYFQPKVNLQTNTVEGVEALLRWNRDNSEDIGPEEFIPIIESTELIHTIGAWVVNEACIACKKWHDAGNPLSVSVNVSALQLTRSGFYQTVADALENSGLSSNFLEIEVTEHSLIKEVSLVNLQLAALKALGVGLAIDDFGTGYSNMIYLTRLQIDVIKLDKSFISRIAQSEEHLVIVTAIIKMARVLGMKVVAEGVESEHELKILKELGCDYGQGYFWSKAVPGSKLIEVVHGL